MAGNVWETLWDQAKRIEALERKVAGLTDETTVNPTTVPTGIPADDPRQMQIPLSETQKGDGGA